VAVARAMSANHSRRTLALLIGVFALPMLISIVAALAGYRPGADNNVGELLSEPIDFRAVEALRSNGERIVWNAPDGLWHVLVPLPEGECGAPCARMVDSMQRVWLGLARKNTRVRVLFVGRPDAATIAALAKFPQAAVATLGSNPLLLSAPALAPRAADGSENLAPLPVFLIDPNGWHVMRYAAGTDPRGLRKDLRRLVR
jgi:hypothetical protein